MNKLMRNSAKSGSPALVALAFAAVATVSCGSDSAPTPAAPATPAPLVSTHPFPEISDITFVASNNFADDYTTAIVYAQGGPVPMLTEDELLETIEESGLKSNTSIAWVSVHQTQTKNPEMFSGAAISPANAYTLSAPTTANLKKAVDYFKGESKKVYVLGFSYGAFAVAELIDAHGTDIADGFMAAGGRLDLETELVDMFRMGLVRIFTIDSDTKALAKDPTSGAFEFVEPPADDDDPNPPSAVVMANMAVLATGFGARRYVTELADVPSLAKLTYVYSNLDQDVGAMTAAELAFLNTKGATVHFEVGVSHSEVSTAMAERIKQVFDIR